MPRHTYFYENTMFTKNKMQHYLENENARVAVEVRDRVLVN